MADQSFEEQEPLDLKDTDTSAIYRKERIAFTKTFHIGGRNHDKEGGSTAKTTPDKTINPVKKTIPMHSTQITSLDSLGQVELDSYKDSNLDNTKQIVKAEDPNKT